MKTTAALVAGLCLAACGAAPSAKYSVKTVVARAFNGNPSGPGTTERGLAVVLSDSDRGCAELDRLYPVLYPGTPGATIPASAKDGEITIALVSTTFFGDTTVDQLLTGKTLQIGATAQTVPPGIFGAFGAYSAAATAFESTGIREGYLQITTMNAATISGSYYLRSGEIIVEGSFDGRVCP